MARLRLVEGRLAKHAEGPAPAGLTEPDEGATEQWEAGQVWAHMAEMVPYWHGQARMVIDAFHGEPVPFGRLKDDPGRLAGIELGRREAVRQMSAQLGTAISELNAFMSSLNGAQWAALGLHPTRGEMKVEEILGRFVVSHLEEHADQLDLLASS